MAYFQFIWLDRVIEKLDGRQIGMEDAEQVVCDPLDNDVSKSSRRPMALG